MSPHLPAMKPPLDLESVILVPLASSNVPAVCPLANPADHPIFTRARLAEAFNDPKTFGLLAKLKGVRHPVGFLLVRRAGQTLIVEALAVVHEYRRAGLARRLLQTLVNMYGADFQLVAYVPLGNTAACRFFTTEGLGFTPGLIADFFRDDDAVVFRRPIDQCEGK